MTFLLDSFAAGWPIYASLGVVVAGQAVERRRRRDALNRGLHELRRPLQAMALSPRCPGSMELALQALADLDRTVNGGPADAQPSPVRCRDLMEAAVLRARGRAAARGAEVRTRWMGGSGLVVGDRLALSAALDNLLANAIEHGGPSITVAASVKGGRLRMAVRDSGPVAGKPKRRSPRHGHGLGVVRSVAADHGGRFAIQRSKEGAVAMLELPLA